MKPSIEFGGIQNFYYISKKHFGKLRRLQTKANIIIYDGFDNCRWNGGRINADIKLEDYKNHFELLNISIASTFSNYKIDLDDTVGNKLLNQLSNHYVVLNNDELNNYITNNYPTITRILSFTSLDCTTQDYLKREDYYDLIVPKIDLLFNEEFLSKINKSKYQILLDEQCNKCPIFFEHYNEVCDINNHTIQLNETEIKQKHSCYLIDKNIQNTLGLELVSKKHISRLVDLGFKHFKIPGREKSLEFQERVFLNSYEIFMSVL